MTLNEYAEMIHNRAVEKGWWEEERNFGEMIALMHSELSEALEEQRDGRANVWYAHDRTISGFPKPEGVATELVDCMIRILDTLHSMHIDIDTLLLEKHHYNGLRPYRHGGKLS